MISILHVDDDPNALELTRIRIQRASKELHFEGVESADVALKMVEAGGFDCVISDYQMPGMSGLEFLRRLREEENLIPFIFLTGQGSEELAAEALRAGADDYYPKDAGFADLERLLNSIFHAVERHRERANRLQTVAEMRESEWRYRLLFATSTDALTLLTSTNGGAELKIIDINPAAEAIFSVEKQKVVGTGFDTIPWTRESGLLEIAKTVAGSGRAEVHNGFGRSRKNITSNLYRLPSGEVLVNSIDTSAQRETMSALRQSEQRYRSLFESSRDVIFISTVDGQFIDINPRGLEVFGYSRSELLQNNVEMIYANPEDRKKFKEAVAEKGYLENFPTTYKRKDGGIIHGMLSSTVIADSVGKILGYQGIIRDVTEQKEMEEQLRRSESRFRDLTENSSDLIWESDARNRFIYLSPRVKDILGYEQAEVLGKTPLDMIAGEDVEQEASLIMQRYNERRFIERMEYKCMHKDGKLVVLETSAIPKFSDEGIFRGYRGIARDITDRKIAEKLLKERTLELNKRLQELRCLFDLYKITTMENLSLDQIYRDAVKILPLAFQYPFAACARLKLGNDTFLSDNFNETEWRLSSDVLIHDVKEGEVEVFYHEEFPEIEEGPFLKEERELLDAVASQLARTTWRIQAETAERSHYEFLQTLIDTIPSPVFSKDLENRYRLCNKAFAEIILGKPKEEILGRSAFDFPDSIPKEQAEEYSGKDKELIRTGGLQTYEDQVQCADGIRRDFILSKATKKDANGNVDGIVGVMVDISERKTADEALQKRAKLEMIASHFIKRIFGADSSELDNVFHQALKAIGEFVGVDRANIFVMTDDQSSVSITYEWCAEGISHLIEHFQNLPTSNMPWLHERVTRMEVIHIPDVDKLPPSAALDKMMLAKGGVRSVLLVPFAFKGKASGLFGFDSVRRSRTWAPEDISLLKTMGEVFINATNRLMSERALRESEEKYRNLIERANDGIAIIQDGKFVFVNYRLAEMTGYSIEEATGKPFSQFIAPEEIEKVSQNYRHRMAGEEVPLIYDTIVVDKDGKRRFVELNAGFIIYEGKPADLVFVRDITERKILQSRLTQAQKLEAIGQLAAGIAHEINTPTQYVGDNISFLVDAFDDLTMLIDKDLEIIESLKKGSDAESACKEAEQARKTVDFGYLAEEMPKALQQSLSGVEQVAKIVRAMKDFSHPGQDEKTATDLNRAIESTITVARNEWKYFAEVETDFDNELPLIRCLANEFNQVILNMIVNATHAIADVVGDGSSGEKGRIKISTRRDDSWVEIRVSDSGTGIPEEVKPRIFDPFFTTKTVGKGTGQGLAISHNVIVDKHGGTITFETEMGKGTTFIIRIPIGTDGS
jgi:PAS domain S-box-containing protein